MKKYLFALCVGLLGIFSLPALGWNLYELMEEKYQSDADIARAHHFNYYIQLLEEYKTKKGYYPFQNQNKGILNTLGVSIMTQEQENHSGKSYFGISKQAFFQELSSVLGRNIEEKYDPQRISTGCPTAYMYFVDNSNNSIQFMAFLRHPNDLTHKYGNIKNCYSLVYSNIQDEKKQFFSYETIQKNNQFKELLSNPIHKRFQFLDEQHKFDSVVGSLYKKTGIPDGFYDAINRNDISYIKQELKEHRYNLNTPYEEAKMNQPYLPLKPLYWAARRGYIEIAELLLNAGADINGLDGFHDTALITALENGHTDMVKFLVEKGADVNIPTSFGVTPFAGACAHETPELIKLMLDHGGNPEKAFPCTVDDCVGEYNKTPLEFASMNKTYSKEITDLLNEAIKNRNK